MFTKGIICKDKVCIYSFEFVLLPAFQKFDPFFLRVIRHEKFQEGGQPKKKRVHVLAFKLFTEIFADRPGVLNVEHIFQQLILIFGISICYISFFLCFDFFPEC